MFRTLLILCLAFQSQILFAEEPRFTARIAWQVVREGQPTKVNAKLAGKWSEPLKAILAGDENRFCELTLAGIAGPEPHQYRAKFSLIETKADATEMVVAAPQLVVLAGQTAKITVGDPAGNGMEIELMVEEN